MDLAMDLDKETRRTSKRTLTGRGSGGILLLSWPVRMDIAMLSRHFVYPPLSSLSQNGVCRLGLCGHLVPVAGEVGRVGAFQQDIAPLTTAVYRN